MRGLPRHRYAGDSTLYGSVLRATARPLSTSSRFRFILPGTWGVLGFADVGRVWLDGEDSNLWHEGYGGGLWFAWLDRGNTVSAPSRAARARTPSTSAPGSRSREGRRELTRQIARVGSLLSALAMIAAGCSRRPAPLASPPPEVLVRPSCRRTCRS